MAVTAFETGEARPARVAGPAWSRPGLEIAAGRFPLGVERHILAMADVLVPGITTVTPHARYYALHGLVARTAADRSLDVDETDSLRRRCEVVMALASRPHQHSETGDVLPGAHGADALVRNVPAGPIDLAAAARSGPGGFAESARGFLNPYQASEVDLQVITSDANPQPGRRYDDGAVRDALGDVIDIADAGTLDPADLDGLGHLCVCAGAEASDGAWLGTLLSAADAPRASRAGGRRETLRAFGRVLQTHDVDSPARQVAELLAYGDFAAGDPVVSQLDTARAWRGALLRNYSVGAWRQLWRWLVDQVHFSQGLTADELAAAFAAEVPRGTVGQFLSSLPAARLPSGEPAPAELELRGAELSEPHCSLAVLAIGAERSEQLTGRVREAFLGRAGVADLAPGWMALRLADNRGQQLRDFVVDLTANLLARAERISQQKARRNDDGTLWLPTRLHQRGRLLFTTGREGTRPDLPHPDRCGPLTEEPQSAPEGRRMSEPTTATTITLTDVTDASGRRTGPVPRLR